MHVLVSVCSMWCVFIALRAFLSLLLHFMHCACTYGVMCVALCAYCFCLYGVHFVCTCVGVCFVAAVLWCTLLCVCGFCFSVCTARERV